jgi:hypothetical protein
MLKIKKLEEINLKLMMMTMNIKIQRILLINHYKIKIMLKGKRMELL